MAWNKSKTIWSFSFARQQVAKYYCCYEVLQHIGLIVLVNFSFLNLFSCFLSLCVATLCDGFLSWWCPIFGDSLDLWCSFFALVMGILWICGVASLLWCVAGSLVQLWQFDQRQFWVFCICLDPSTWIGNKNFLLFIICERELFEYIGVLGYVRVPRWNSPSSPLNVGQKPNHVNPWCLLFGGAFAQHI